MGPETRTRNFIYSKKNVWILTLYVSKVCLQQVNIKK